MATATAIAIKAAQEAERQANALNEINDRLARIEALLTKNLPDVDSLKTAIFDDMLNAVNTVNTSNKPVAPKVGRPSSTG